MFEGDTVNIVCPPETAYGSEGNSEKGVPPNEEVSY